MGLIIVTKGYMWIAILIMALLMAIKNQTVMPAPLNGGAKFNPIVVSNVERMLAIALGLGLFVSGMAAFSDIFPPILGPEVKVACDGLCNYVGL